MFLYLLSVSIGRPYGVPPLFVWRDEASGAELVVTSESGYGGPGTEFVLPNGVSQCTAVEQS